MSLSDPLRVTRVLVAALEQLGIPYFVGGSLTSSLYGIPRSTQDVDVIIDAERQKLLQLCKALEPHFFVDELMALSALQHGGVFNVIDKEDMFKVDVFLSRDELTRLEMEHRQEFALSEDGLETIMVCSAEDIVAHKLYWYRLGDNVSERQWHDVLNVLKVQQGRLDVTYLRMVAEKRGVLDLLEQALMQP
jgi:hypothetical protein